MKVEIFAQLDFVEKDIIELDDDLTDDEIEEAVYDYISEYFEWSYKKLDEENCL